MPSSRLFPSILPDTGEGEDDEEICGTEMDDGSICDRPADSCGYH